jgi:hypothetical protein
MVSGSSDSPSGLVVETATILEKRLVKRSFSRAYARCLHRRSLGEVFTTPATGGH